MTDTTPEPTFEQRQAAMTETDQILVPTGIGPLMAIDAFDRDQRVGAVWMSLSPDRTPRAGIVVGDGKDLNGVFQQQLGMATLAMSRDTEIDALEWLTVIADLFPLGGEVGVEANPYRVEDVEALRVRVNRPL